MKKTVEVLGEVYTEKELADLLGLSLRTVQNRRYANQNLPPYIPVSRGRVMYRRDEVNRWLHGREHYPKEAS